MGRGEQETECSGMGKFSQYEYGLGYREGAHLALKQITLGYNLPDRISKKAGLSGVRFFLTAENLFYLSNYSGGNPEVVNIYTGRDNGDTYPLPRKYTLGLTLNF